MTAAPVFTDLRDRAAPVAAVNGGSRASVACRARTASRLVEHLPAPQALSSPLASARCALTPRIGTSPIHAVTAGGHRDINSSPYLRLRRSGRTLLRQRRSGCRRRACITELWPNPAFERTRRQMASTCRMSARRAAQLVRWGSWRSPFGVSCVLRSAAVPTPVVHRSQQSVGLPHRLPAPNGVHLATVPMRVAPRYRIRISIPHRACSSVVAPRSTVPCVN